MKGLSFCLKYRFKYKPVFIWPQAVSTMQSDLRCYKILVETDYGQHAIVF